MEFILTWSEYVAFALLSLSLVMVFIRLLIGPSLPDRVVALDMTAYLVIGFTALYTLVTAEPAFLDAAITLALISFLATVAFARYVEHIHQIQARRQAEQANREDAQ
jgi:multicomponent Na+:H+ antiporter subunit F